MSEHPFRVLPRVDERNAYFWRGGREGQLCLRRCGDCGTWIHPPSPICPRCTGRDLRVEAVAGTGTVVSFTLNHQPWVPAPDHPYAIVLVDLDEQPELRLMSNVVNCPAESVHIGMRVRVVFDEYEAGEGEESVWIPLFEPLT